MAKIGIGKGKNIVLVDGNPQPPPSGLITENRVAEWFFDENSGQRGFNNVAGNTSNDNIIGVPQGHFANFQYFTSLSYYVASGSGDATVTENFADNGEGLMIAARLVTAAGSGVNPSTGEIPGLRLNSILAPAGDNAFGVRVKSNTGSNQSCRLQAPSGTLSTDKTITTDWTIIETTFNLGAPTSILAAIRNGSAGDPLDILIDWFKINPGTSLTTFKDTAFDFTFGVDAVAESKDPTWVSGKGVALSGSSQNGTAVTKQAVNLSSITIHSIAKMDASSPDQGFLLNTSFNETGFIFSWGEGGTDDSTLTPRFQFGTAGGNTSLKCQKLGDGAVHHVCATYDGVTVKVWVDNILLGERSATISPIALRRLLLGDTSFVNNRGFAGEVYYCSIFSVAHTDEQRLQQYNALSSLMATRSITLATPNIFINFEGDSISTVPQGGTYPRKATRSYTTPIWAQNTAVVGDTVSDLEARAATIDAMYDASRTHNILFVLIGANDMAGGGTAGADFYADLKSYCQDRQAAGWEVVACTVLPRNDAAFNTERNIANGLISGDSSFYDVLCDFAADATMGQDAAAANPTYYPDGTHPSDTGHAILAPIAKAAIDTLLV